MAYSKTRKNKRKYRTKRKNIKGGGNHITVYPPDSIKKYISHVIYVNLDSRTDRRAQIENELKIFNPEQIHRIPGIVPDIKGNRTLALAKAHLNAIKMARDNNWNNTLFLEDDSIWANIEKGYPVFEKLIKEPYDAIMLGSHLAVYDKNTYRIIDKATSGASYLLNQPHYNIVIEKIEELIKSFNNNSTEDNMACDLNVFVPLQKKYKWFAVVPVLMKQRISYSDRTLEDNKNHSGSNTK